MSSLFGNFHSWKLLLILITKLLLFPSVNDVYVVLYLAFFSHSEVLTCSLNFISNIDVMLSTDINCSLYHEIEANQANREAV